MRPKLLPLWLTAACAGLVAALLVCQKPQEREPAQDRSEHVEQFRFAGHAPVSRSPQWPTVRKHHLEKEPACAVCGATDPVEVHHVLPFHLPGGQARELDPDNLITLCRVHHFWVGHLGDFKAYNPDVRRDAAHWKGRLAARKYD